MDRDTLLPCPFCGGRADMNDGYPFALVICDDCGARVMGIALKEAIAKWNTRPDLRNRHGS